MLRQLRSQKGMTLVELMVVVAIIAIIAAIAITLFQDIQKKSKHAADMGTTASLRSAVALYYGKNNGIFPSSEAVLYGLVTPVPSWQCQAGTSKAIYTPANGKVEYTYSVAQCN
jgi:prepilin-type N-terminal cleavage/methylation domain-containing protein